MKTSSILQFALAAGLAQARWKTGKPTFTVVMDTNTIEDGGAVTTCQAAVCSPGTALMDGNCPKHGNGAYCNFDSCSEGETCKVHWNGVHWTFKITEIDELRTTGMHVHYKESDKGLKVKTIKSKCHNVQSNHFYVAGEDSVQGIQCKLFDLKHV